MKDTDTHYGAQQSINYDDSAKRDCQVGDNDNIENTANHAVVQTVSENDDADDYPDDETNTNIENNVGGAFEQAPTSQQQQEKEDYQWNDADIQRDAATQNVSMVVHFALAFFAALVIIAGVLILVMVSEFGLVAFMSLMVMASFLGGVGCFVNHVLKNEVQLRPVQRKIRRWKALTAAVVIQEMRNFQLDWHDHLLLTDGTADDVETYDDYHDINNTNGGVAKDVEGDTSLPMRRNHKPRGASRSVVFGLVVKPFLKVKGFRKRRMQKKEDKRKQQQQGGDSSENGSKPDVNATYVPPINNDSNDIV